MDHCGTKVKISTFQKMAGQLIPHQGLAVGQQTSTRVTVALDSYVMDQELQIQPSISQPNLPCRVVVSILAGQGRGTSAAWRSLEKAWGKSNK